MSFTAQNLMDDFGLTYAGVPDATVLSLLNEADKIIQRAFKHRQKTVNLMLVEGEDLIDLSEGVLWVRSASYFQDTVSRIKLGETFEDTLDLSGEWRHQGNASPSCFYQTHDLLTGQMGLDRKSLYSTLTVSGATNATPIVVTTQTHGLSDGDRVDILEVGGNTAANGGYYAKVTGYSTTTFALYSDSGLTTAVAGNGAYTSGGFISCAGSPYIEAICVWHSDLGASDSLQTTPLLKNLYVDGMCFLWAKRKNLKDDTAFYKAAFEDTIAEQVRLTKNRAGHAIPKIRTIQPNTLGYTGSRY